jgi:hypothetical protein
MDFLPTASSIFNSKDTIETCLKSIYGVDVCLSEHVFAALNLQLPTFDLPKDKDAYLLSFHTEYMLVPWVIEQAQKVYPKPVWLITDFDIVSQFPWPDNIAFKRFITLSQQLQLAINKYGILDTKSVVMPKHKISSLSYRITQSKKFITAYLLKNFPHEHMILSYHNHLGKIDDHHGYPPHYKMFDSIGLDQLKKTLINLPDEQDQINLTPLQNAFWQVPAYQDSWINLTNESYHYSGSMRDGRHFQYPGPYLTEKTFKPLLAGRPFVPVGQAHTVKFLQNLGLSLDFGLNFDFDNTVGDLDRMLEIFEVIDYISTTDLQQLFDSSLAAVQHNLLYISSGELSAQCDKFNQSTVKFLMDTF